MGSCIDGSIQTQVKITCPACGRIQVVDLQDWQTSQSWWLVGDRWAKGGPAYTCVNGHPSIEMVPAWEMGDNGA